MNADKNLIEQISFGKISIEEKENGLFFRRTSDKVSHAFFERSDDLGEKTYASACVNFDFYTDSKTIKLEYCDVIKGSSRKWYYFDVVVNGALKVHTGNADFTENNSGEVVVNLDGKLNRVTIYSPMLVGYTLKSLSFDDGSKIIPVVKKCKILALGDSITHGYDEIYPSFAYTNLIARYFDAEVINQALTDGQNGQFPTREIALLFLIKRKTGDTCFCLRSFKGVARSILLCRQTAIGRSCRCKRVLCATFFRRKRQNKSRCFPVYRLNIKNGGI